MGMSYQSLMSQNHQSQNASQSHHQMGMSYQSLMSHYPHQSVKVRASHRHRPKKD
jgi:hypothetical protein